MMLFLFSVIMIIYYYISIFIRFNRFCIFCFRIIFYILDIFIFYSSIFNNFIIFFCFLCRIIGFFNFIFYSLIFYFIFIKNLICNISFIFSFNYRLRIYIRSILNFFFNFNYFINSSFFLRFISSINCKILYFISIKLYKFPIFFRDIISSMNSIDIRFCNLFINSFIREPSINRSTIKTFRNFFFIKLKSFRNSKKPIKNLNESITL